jgi:hypothetical protein
MELVSVTAVALLAGCATADSLLLNGAYVLLTEANPNAPAREDPRWAKLTAWRERARCEREAHQAEWQAKWRWTIGPDWKLYEAEQQRIDAELRAAKKASLIGCEREYETLIVDAPPSDPGAR